jgi:RNA polymerase sigma-70 factor (ECF subfamily)
MPLRSPDEPLPDIERYRPLLRVMAWQLHTDRRLRRRFDGSDVVQETMRRACEGLEQFRGSSNAELLKWLQTILHNTFRDMVEKEFADRRTPEMEASLAGVLGTSSACLEKFLEASQPSPSEQMEGNEVWLRFASAVETLPRDQRDVVLLRDVYNLPVKKIAEQVGRSEKAVAGLLLRGRYELRRSFPDYQ